ncbi:MAG: hypothetical protein R6V05_15615 [Candidatus Brocadiia bacterium]
MVSQLAPPTRYLTRRRLERLMFAHSERHRPIKLITWRRFVAAAAVAAIIAAVPFIVGDFAQILNPPAAPQFMAQQPRPADPVAVVLSSASTARGGDGQGVRCVPVRSGPGGPPGSVRVVRTDTAGVAVPIRHTLYDADESSRWW